ncbi:aldehyde dehydrogenase family protein [Streptomyces bacillaris]
MSAAPVWSVDPRSGNPREQVAVEATAEEVDRAVRAAHSVRDALADRTARAAFLRTAAELLEESGAHIIEAADAETALGPARLTGELARTAAQLRAFAEVVEEGGYLDIRIDHEDGSRTPPWPDLRRWKIPLGVVAVYAASNFPLAFSVPGGDTASALAAGCPVVVKAHPGHPATSELCASVLRRAAARTGLPEDVVTLVHGFDAGLGASMTLGTGQFCTKPGFVLAPAGGAGDQLVKALTETVSSTGSGVMLDHRMRDAFLAGVRERAALPGVEAPVTPGAAGEHTVSAGFLTVPADRLTAEGPHDALLEECFGPVTVIARYATRDEVAAVLARLPGNLTATLRTATEGEDPGAAGLLAALTPLAGRILVNGWPTGVAVAPAQHHGGPYPATTSPTTSVGATAIERWLRPVTYQNTPDALLPPELREANPLGLPRRVDGRRA